MKDAELFQTKAFIDGKWVDANDGATLKVTSECITLGRCDNG